MKKKTFLKSLSFTSLALLMGAAGVFAFAPLGAGPSVAKASEMSTQASESLVIPKADDPVIFTTESGIEIKWGNAATASGGGNETGTYSYNSYVSGVGIPAPTQYSNLTSGNLSGFPYFTTTGNGKTYTWVIIGKNPNLGNASKTYNGSNTSAKTEYKTLADWQAKINSSDTYENYINGYSPTHKSFFNDTYEANTPAGVAIKNNGILNQTTARTYSASLSYSYTVDMLSSSSVKTNSEIPSGCVLVWSNEPIETFVWSSSYSSSANMFIDSNNTARKKCISYYNNDTFGFGSSINQIQYTTLKQQGMYSSGTNSSTTQMYFFPPGQHSSYDNFKWNSYLTATQAKHASYPVFCRTNATYSTIDALLTSGSAATTSYSSTGVLKLMFVMKV